MGTLLRNLLLLAGISVLGVSQAHADLSYSAQRTDDGLRFVVISGSFSYDDNLDEFSQLVRSHDPSLVTFNSPGGNVSKAMELGRLIRSYRLGTIQFRGSDCSSACSLAFMGGIQRLADAGSIGVHKASYSDSSRFSTEEAVSHVQAITAEVIMYMGEMGVDPALLQLSLQYDSDDIRYLSRSEMEKYRVVTIGGTSTVASSSPAYTPTPPVAPAPATPPRTAGARVLESQLTIPVARSGRVRHPKGKAPVKLDANGDSPTLANLQNGTPLRILDSHDRWFRVQSGRIGGYMHHTWVYVDQFESGPFGHRHVQIKSYDNVHDAIRFAENSPLPLDVYLSSNSWYAVTLQGTFDESSARAILKSLKTSHQIPDDSFMTYANTYVRKLCCN